MLMSAISRDLRLKFIAVSIPLSIAVSVLMLFVFWFMAQDLIRDLGQRTATNQVLLDRARAAQPLLRELTLAEVMAKDPLIIAWLQDVNDRAKQRQAFASLARYRNGFQAGSFFIVPKSTRNFYFNDGTKDGPEDFVEYTLSPENSDDEWFFRTAELPGTCYLNVDYDRTLKKTKVWFNCNFRDVATNSVVGVGGTGIELTQFVDDLQRLQMPGVTSIYADVRGAIQAHPDINLIEHDALTKPDNLSSTILSLVDREEDREMLSAAMDRARGSPNSAETVWVQIDEREYLMGISFILDMDWFSVSVMDLETLIFGQYYVPLSILIALAVVLNLIIISIALEKLILKRVYQLDDDVMNFKQDNAWDIKTGDGQAPDQIGRLQLHTREMADAVRQQTRTLEALVTERTRELEELATRDPLTGARNRRSFFDSASDEARRMQRFGGMTSILMLDLDHFKSINDSNGHGVGDDVLKAFSELCMKTLRDIDVFARLGGEEFAALLIGTEQPEAVQVAERIRTEFSKLTFDSPQGEFSATVSIGVSRWSDPTVSIDRILDNADQALYDAKKNGRNRVETWRTQSDLR